MTKPPLLYINDDAQCIERLKAANKLDVLQVPPGKYSATCCYEHEGFYVMATRFEHHDDPKENGYTMVMLPMNAMSKQDAAALFMDILDKCIGREHLSFVEKEV